MRYAAIMTATHGALRPSELLGSPVLRERALLMRDVTFFASADGTQPVPLCSPAAYATTALPYRFEIALGASKADQAGTNPPVPIAAPSAVRALWTWMHAHARIVGTSDPRIFVERTLLRIVPLGVRPLCTHVEAALDLAGISHPRITGKAFRRGGASALTAAGVPTSVIAAAMRHRSLSMQDRYSDSASKAARVIAASRAMEADSSQHQ